MQTSKKPYPIERLLSAATYLTAGGVGFVWLIVTALCKKRVTQFALYHIMQSIFISILFYLISAKDHKETAVLSEGFHELSTAPFRLSESVS